MKQNSPVLLILQKSTLRRQSCYENLIINFTKSFTNENFSVASDTFDPWIRYLCSGLQEFHFLSNICLFQSLNCPKNNSTNFSVVTQLKYKYSPPLHNRKKIILELQQNTDPLLTAQWPSLKLTVNNMKIKIGPT